MEGRATRTGVSGGLRYQVGARQPEALKPAPPKPRPATPRQPARRETLPGDLICGGCGEGNDPKRRFCRGCGASLLEVEVEAPPPPVVWWKRPFVRSRNKVVAAGERPIPVRRGGSASYRTLRGKARRYTRVFALVAALAVGVGFVGPWRSTLTGGPRGLFRSAQKKVTPKLNPVRPVNAEASSALAGHPGTAAVDGIKNTYWAENAPGDGDGQQLVLTFDPPVHLGKIGFTVGASSKPEEFVGQPRPERVRLRFADGSMKDLTLADKAEFQQYDLNARNTDRLEIEILSTRRSLQSGTNASIAEIEFWERI